MPSLVPRRFAALAAGSDRQPHRRRELPIPGRNARSRGLSLESEVRVVNNELSFRRFRNLRNCASIVLRLLRLYRIGLSRSEQKQPAQNRRGNCLRSDSRFHFRSPPKWPGVTEANCIVRSARPINRFVYGIFLVISESEKRAGCGPGDIKHLEREGPKQSAGSSFRTEAQYSLAAG